MKALLVVGNGITIDLIQTFKIKNVDAMNMFRLGAEVTTPTTNEKGFLSNKHCKHLWALGARPGLAENEAMQIIENIITCGNVVSLDPSSDPASMNDNIYMQAYYELTSYLRSLFVEYNRRFDMPSHDLINKWGWVRKISELADNPGVEEITIISFNYDIFIERLLINLGIKFNCPPFTSSENKISIIKPHGSIAFKRKNGTATKPIVKESFENLDINEIEVDFNSVAHDDAYVPLIPPAGDSNRGQAKWIQQLQKCCLERAKGLSESDLLIIGGLSYWSVDRLEIDKILVALPRSVSCKMVNPNSPPSLDMVVSALFKNYTLYTTIDSLDI
ncbi:hypothetical protein [Leptothrix ochracea]|uniref:hypothetical protein n=1 Tax=Leptothrix ochracea TaxID=735331 RepID=UPI0034E2F058